MGLVRGRGGDGLLIREEEHYRVSHALIHTYIRQRLSVADDAVTRLVHYYETLAHDQRDQVLHGYDRLDSQRTHIMAILDWVTSQRKIGVTLLKLVQAIDQYLNNQGHWTERLKALNTGLEAAQIVGDQHAEGKFLNELGRTHYFLGQIEEGIACLERALALHRITAHQQAEADGLSYLAIIYHHLGQDEQAIECNRRALAIDRKLGNRPDEVDSFLDVVVANENNEAETVWLNTGSGSFVPHPTAPDFGGSNSYGVALADVDGDGDNDKVCRYTGVGNTWNGAYNSHTANSITRNGITQLSDWAGGNNVGPTPITQQGFGTSISNKVGLVWVLGIVIVTVCCFYALRKQT